MKTIANMGEALSLATDITTTATAATTDAARNVMTETEIVRSVLIKKSHGDEDCGHDYGDNLCTLESEFGLTS